MAGEIVIPPKNTITNTKWQNGDTYVSAGVVFTRMPDGSWKAPGVTLTKTSDGGYKGKLTPAQQKSSSSTGAQSTGAAAAAKMGATQTTGGSSWQDYLNTSGMNTGLPVGQEWANAYDLNTDPGFLLNQMPPLLRDKTLKILFDHGQYGGSKMQNGTGPADISAFQDLLRYANVKNLKWTDALNAYQQDVPKKAGLFGGAGKAPAQVTNPDDLKAVFKKASQDLLGRAIDDKLADHFVSTFQNQQVQQQAQVASKSGGVVVQAPDAGVSAQKMIEQKYGQEVRVQNAANFGNIMDQMIKGLAR
jgi:hypothetical protein